MSVHHDIISPGSAQTAEEMVFEMLLALRNGCEDGKRAAEEGTEPEMAGVLIEAECETEAAAQEGFRVAMTYARFFHRVLVPHLPKGRFVLVPGIRKNNPKVFGWLVRPDYDAEEEGGPSEFAPPAL